MAKKVFVYDPTVSDQRSKVRGIGRYLQILRENFENEFIFTNNPSSVIYHLLSFFINPFFNFLQPPLTIKRLAQKQIAVIHDLIPLKYPSRFPAGIKGGINIVLNRYALRNYDLIITDSEASKKDIIEILKIKEDKIKVIYPCLPKIFTDSGVAHAPQNDVILANDPPVEGERVQNLPKTFGLYVGDATWNKNLVNLAKAIKIANVSCVFVGKVFHNNDSGVANAPQNDVILANDPPVGGERVQNLNHSWQKELKEFYELTRDDKRFIFRGFVSDEDLINLYQQACCNILPSRDEGFGFSYLEAASQHCPSVLANISVLREISGKNALFVDPEKPDEIVNAIGKLSSDETKREQIGELAFKRSLFFSQKNFKDQLLKIISL